MFREIAAFTTENRVAKNRIRKNITSIKNNITIKKDRKHLFPSEKYTHSGKKEND